MRARRGRETSLFELEGGKEPKGGGKEREFGREMGRHNLSKLECHQGEEKKRQGRRENKFLGIDGCKGSLKGGAGKCEASINARNPSGYLQGESTGGSEKTIQGFPQRVIHDKSDC